MTVKQNRPDDTVAEMRQREIRDILRSLDPIDVEAQYLAAAQTGDELFLSAIEESPIPFSFATKGLVDRVRFSRLEKAYPEQATKLADLRTAQSNVSSALKSVTHDLKQQGVEIASEGLEIVQAA